MTTLLNRAIEKKIGDGIDVHINTGSHDLSSEDWSIKFADLNDEQVIIVGGLAIGLDIEDRMEITDSGIHPFLMQLPRKLGVIQRSITCFKSDGIDSIMKLVLSDPNYIWDEKRNKSKILNFGKKSWDDLTKNLGCFDLRIGMTAEEIANWEPSDELQPMIALIIAGVVE